MLTERGKAYAAWLAVCFFWGTTYVAIRFGVQHAPALLFNGGRVLVAGWVVMAWLRLRGQPFPSRREWAQLSVIGVALLGVGNGFVSWSAQWVPSGLISVSLAMTPFWMVGAESLRPGGDRPTWQGLLGLVAGCAGLGLLVMPRLQSTHLDSAALLGFAGLQLSCMSWSVGSIYSRQRPVPVHPMMGAAVQMIVGGTVVVVAGTLMGEWGRLIVTPAVVAAFLYLLLFGSIVGFSAYIYALQKLPVSTVSLYAYINPVIALALGWLLLHERLSTSEILGALVILAGVAVVRRAPVHQSSNT